MCLAVPMKIVQLLPEGMARGEHHHVRVEFTTALLDEVAEGDFVLVHAGVALERLDERSARETLAMLKQVVDGPDGL
jgi:hydrogenase expression/formation protein HypC